MLGRLLDKQKGAFLGALVADALTLPTHYEYDAEKINKFYGSIDKYYAPGEKTGGETHGVGWGARNFHNGNDKPGGSKKGGEQTDYGDYNLLILEYLCKCRKNQIDLPTLIPFWKKKLETEWRSWICTQTRQTYQQVGGASDEQLKEAGTQELSGVLGGMSNAMSLRSAAAFAVCKTEDEAVEFARLAMFTHQEPTAHAGAEFFTRVAFRLVNNSDVTIAEVINDVASKSNSFVKDKVKQAVDKVAEVKGKSTDLSKIEEDWKQDDYAITSFARLWDVGKSEPIKVGKASPTEGTLPASLYFILKYGTDESGANSNADGMIAAFKANANVGGDNASRSIAIGMVLGAAQGVGAIPTTLGAEGLVEWKNANQWLDGVMQS
eukprot:TRINITY_DN11539_c3_g1_i1.p1 TRINITY_DN11539_c3_g1~~TRINITY_DN11539_c3_g1_i1.p1  ORF type:complete len:379 (-),score=26.92 TRINITY_DN11539_c3_g1_i1:240-1376(-)